MAAGRLTAAGRRFEFQHVSIGNPQCVIEAGDQLEQLDLQAIGPDIEHSELFPNRTNVAFIRIDSEQRVRARIFERGVGETLSSGTGASDPRSRRSCAELPARSRCSSTAAS